VYLTSPKDERILVAHTSATACIATTIEDVGGKSKDAKSGLQEQYFVRLDDVYGFDICTIRSKASN